MINEEYKELIEEISHIIENDFKGLKRLLQNCRIVLRRRAKKITYCYRQTEIIIDKIMAWKILCILGKLDIKDEKKKVALDNILDELGLKKRKSK